MFVHERLRNTGETTLKGGERKGPLLRGFPHNKAAACGGIFGRSEFEPPWAEELKLPAARGQEPAQ